MTTKQNNKEQPQTIAAFLEQLRAALGAADPALVQDALYDAEEYLRAEWAQTPDLSEAALLARVIPQFGSPEEAAAAYCDTEIKVKHAMRTPAPNPPQSLLGRIFGVYADARTYASLFYMLLSFFTGMFYFIWAAIGGSLSLGFGILIIGVPFFLLFIASVRILSLVEGRIVETLLGERMPRRPVYPQAQGFWDKIKGMLTDTRTWTTLLYMFAMMPLGMVYFMAVLIGLVVPVALMVAPFGQVFIDHIHFPYSVEHDLGSPEVFLLVPAGFIALTLVLHIARLVGQLHGRLAKHLLVRSGE